MRTITRIIAATVVATVLACGSDSSTGPSGLSPSTSYKGVITSSDGTTAGLLLTFASAVASPPAPMPSAALADPVSVTGVATLPGGGTVNLSGTLDNGTLTMTGSGYTLTGTLTNGKFVGTFTGPAGATGAFTALSSSSVTPAYAYCGTYSAVITPGDIHEDGTFNAVVAGTVLTGQSVQNGGLGDVITIAGTASPGSGGTTNISINSNNAQGSITATGTISADHTTLTGQYQASVAGEPNAHADGTFSGALCPGTTS
jgi:hypothetical protein